MRTSKLIDCILILVINLAFISLAKFNLIEVRGLYAASVIGAGFMFIPREFNFVLYYLLVGILFVNITVLASNTFLGDFYLIEPIFKSSENVFEKVVTRSITIFGVEFKMRRSTGIADNIHVSALINLLLIYLARIKEWKWVFRLSSAVLILNLNLQFIIIFLLWLYLEKTKKNISVSKFALVYIPVGIIFLFLIDQVFGSGGYTAQIFSTKFSLLYWEFISYMKIMNVWSYLFGLPIGYEDIYDNTADYYVPLTDIGVIGIPLQFGIFGLLSIVLFYRFWLKYANSYLRVFLVTCLLTTLHYFSMAAAIGIITIFMLLKLNIIPANKQPKPI